MHKTKTSPNLKVASFFAGIGGICYGFKQAGFDVVYANEFDAKACENYRANHPSTSFHEGDIRKVEAASLPEFDMFAGGFPCQPYSLAGKRNGLADIRGTLFFDIVRILEAKRPPVLFLENVKNIQSTNEGRDFESILDHLKNLGYHIRHEVLGGHTHGNAPSAGKGCSSSASKTGAFRKNSSSLDRFRSRTLWKRSSTEASGRQTSTTTPPRASTSR